MITEIHQFLKVLNRLGFPIRFAMPSSRVQSVLTIGVNTDYHPDMKSNHLSKAYKKQEIMDSLPQEHSLVNRCLAEFVATTLFVFLGVGQALSFTGGDSVLHAAFAHGLAIFLLVAAFGRISGGHINPAVTLGVTLVRRISPITAVCYILSQLAGSFVGALMTRAIASTSTPGNIGATLVAAPFHWYNAVFAETVTTMILVLVVLLTAIDPEKHVLAALAIGMTVCADILTISSISGAAMNPARSFGPNIVGSLFVDNALLPDNYWGFHFVYYLGPFLGALIAAAIYRVFFASDERIMA